MNKWIIFLVVSLLFSSCYKRGELDAKEFELKSFEAWMAKNAPSAVKMEDGVYYEMLESNPGGMKLTADKSWFMMNYSGRTLDNLIFSSRSEAISRQMGKFQYYNHYVPLYAGFSQYSYKYTAGQYKGLSLMHEGDSIRMYLSTTYGNPVGVQDFGEFVFSDNLSKVGISPVIFDMRLVKVVDEPIKYENKLVVDFAINDLELKVEDSIRYGFYMKKTVENPKGDTIGKDSAVYVYYTGRYLDGFIFDTNIDSVAIANHIAVVPSSESGPKYSPMDYMESRDETFSEGWKIAISKMRRGETAEVAFISTYGYGYTGKSAPAKYDGSTLQQTATDIQPYTPLFFEIKVLSERPKN